MRTGYLELVGLQVTFDNVLPEYKLMHYYRKIEVLVPNPVVVMRGYDMVRTQTPADIAESLRKAYDAAVLTVWNQDTVLTSSEYLEFCAGCQPEDLDLKGLWKLRP